MRLVKRNGIRARRGFSLLELMLVLAIMGVLMAVAAVSLLGRGRAAKEKATWVTMNMIKSALQQYYLAKSAYPASLTALQTGTQAYLDKDKPLVDGWNRPFLYQTPGTGGREFDLISKGDDGSYPSADDVNIWVPPQE